MSFTGVDRVHVTTQGSVPADMPQFARAKVESLLRLASEPVPFARVTLTMTADPAVGLPAMARANVDLDGRIIRVQAAGETVREAVGRMSRRLRVRLERAARNWEARRGPCQRGRRGSGDIRASPRAIRGTSRVPRTNVR